MQMSTLIRLVATSLISVSVAAYSHLADARIGCPFATHHLSNSDNGERRHVRQTFSSRKPSLEAVELSRRAVDFERLTSSQTAERNRTRRHMLGVYDFVNPTCTIEAATEVDCDSSYPYRTISGRCNNLANPTWGKHTVPFRRLLRPVYVDGIQEPRSTSYGNKGDKLPNPRLVSILVHRDELKSKDDARYTLMLMQWGQLVDHDLTLTPMAVDPVDNSTLDCDLCDEASVGKYCMPISLPDEEVYFPLTQGGVANCIPFTRSLPGQSGLGHRDQINMNTAYLDASYIFGSTPCRTFELREPNESGRLRALDVGQHGGGHHSMMPMYHEFEDCQSVDGKCFYAGDDRSNEQPGLISLHTVMFREQRRIADQLRGVNPHWSGDRVLHESRKLVAAINQHITYNEFLPRIFGLVEISRSTLRRKFHPILADLLPQPGLGHAPSSHYSPSCSAAIYNEFSTAAFRFGHSLIKPDLHLMTELGRARSLNAKLAKRQFDDLTNETEQLRLHFNNPDVTLKTSSFVSNSVRGMTATPMAHMDAKITPSLTDHLFDIIHRPFSGMDLAALNIQRGRDHGLPGYVFYRYHCEKKYGSDFGGNAKTSKLPRLVASFDELRSIMDSSVVDRLQAVYSHVYDIDLFTGGLAEHSMDFGGQSGRSIVGFTFGCIIASQMRRTKRCDRFWYENLGQFSADQVASVRSVTLAGVLCRNTDMRAMQPMAFDLIDNSANRLQSCDVQSDIDFNLWQH